MRRATTSVLIGGLGLMAAGAGAWWGRTPRIQTLERGPAELLGLGVFHGQGDFPPTLGRVTGYTTEGKAPLALYLRLPASAHGLPGSDVYGPHDPRSLLATLTLPNGSSGPLLIRPVGDRDGAMVQIRRDYPPDLPYLDVTVSVPGAGNSRWRVRGLPGGTTALDYGAPRTSAGTGKRQAIGRAWWERGRKPGSSPALFAAVSMPDFRPGRGESCEIENRIEGPFADGGAKPYVSTGGDMSLDAGRADGVAIATPYAGYARAMRVRGAGRRYRVFDETLDFGTQPLRRRDLKYGMASDAELAIARPLVATTAGGLRLVLPARPTGGDNTQYATGMTLSFFAEADPASLARGLPADMAALARDHPVEVQIAPLDKPKDYLTGIQRDARPAHVIWMDIAPKTVARYAVRMRVRRRILVEEAPFDLVLPVAREPRRTAAPFYEGTTVFNVDPRTLEPIAYSPKPVPRS